MKKTTALILLIIVISFSISVYLYPRFPAQVASHWNFKGEVDSYMSKFWGLFLLPIISIIIFLLFLFLPKIDPLKKNIEKFRKYYDWFIFVLVLYLFYLYLLTIFWTFGFNFNMNQMLAPGFAVLFYAIGVLTENAKRNWFIGIRTPWTLSNEKVWNKTHKLGGRLFKISALISLIGVILPNYAVWFMLVPVLLAAVYVIAYSYFEYQKIAK